MNLKNRQKLTNGISPNIGEPLTKNWFSKLWHEDMEEEGEEEEDLWEDEQAGHDVGGEGGVDGQVSLRGHVAHLNVVAEL